MDTSKFSPKSILILWLPIVGFSKKYTLNFSPGSHNYTHENKHIEKNNDYVSVTYNKEYIKLCDFIRPELKKGQGILFDPNMLHGASINTGSKTRMSVEFRLFSVEVCLPAHGVFQCPTKIYDFACEHEFS